MTINILKRNSKQKIEKIPPLFTSLLTKFTYAFIAPRPLLI